jgi:feruloyl esterase
LDFFKYVVYRDPKWYWHTFDLAGATVLADRTAAVLDAMDPNLSAFQRAGGRLLLFHGWADQNFSAEATIDYYRKSLKRWAHRVGGGCGSSSCRGWATAAAAKVRMSSML